MQSVQVSDSPYIPQSHIDLLAQQNLTSDLTPHLIVDKKYKRTKRTSLDVYSTDAHIYVNATITLLLNIFLIENLISIEIFFI